MPKRKRGSENSAVRSLLTLPVEFFTDPFTPLLAHLPNSTRIANVSTLQGNLRKDRARREGQILQQQMYQKLKGLSNLPGCASGPKPVFTECLFRKQHLLTTTQDLHSEFPLYSLRRREEPPSKDTELPGGGLGWVGQGKPWPGSFYCPTLRGQGSRRGPGQAQVRSFGPHSHSGHIDRLHVPLQFICTPVPVPVYKQAHTAVQGAKS